MNRLAENLSFLVKKTGKPATLVSREMDVCNSTLHLYMHGVTLVNIEMLRKVSKYFNVSIDDLLFSPLKEDSKTELALN